MFAEFHDHGFVEACEDFEGDGSVAKSSCLGYLDFLLAGMNREITQEPGLSLLGAEDYCPSWPLGKVRSEAGSEASSTSKPAGILNVLSDILS